MYDTKEFSLVLSAARDFPEAAARIAQTLFDDLETIDSFHKKVTHIYPTIGRLRAHVSRRAENGLAATGAIIERAGHPLLVRRSRFFDWLSESEDVSGAGGENI